MHQVRHGYEEPGVHLEYTTARTGAYYAHKSFTMHIQYCGFIVECMLLVLLIR